MEIPLDSLIIQENNRPQLGKYLAIGFLFCLTAQVFSFLFEMTTRFFLLSKGLSSLSSIMVLPKLISLAMVLFIGRLCINRIKRTVQLDKIIIYLIMLYFVGNVMQYYSVVSYEYSLLQNNLYLDAVKAYGDAKSDLQSEHEYYKVMIDFGPMLFKYYILTHFFIK